MQGLGQHHASMQRPWGPDKAVGWHALMNAEEAMKTPKQANWA